LKYRKYAKTDKLACLVSDCMDQTVKTILDKEGTGRPFCPFDYTYHLIFNILSASAFNKRLVNYSFTSKMTIKLLCYKMCI
jgi:hypothetical protein